MSAAMAHREAVAPVPPGEPRPLWSVMIPSYNCAGFLRQALESVLVQDDGPEVMQIEVVDDASMRDDPADVVHELGGGRVTFHRQPQNVGYLRNFTTCLRRARGRIIHLLHADDFVRPGFYRRLQRAFVADSHRSPVGAAFCRHHYVDEDAGSSVISPLERSGAGVIEGWLERIATGQRLATPSMVVRREVYETLGGFDGRFTCAGEDWEMWVRIATRYPVWFDPQPLAVYRVKRAGSLTADSSRTSRLVRDMRLATQIIEEYLPQHLPARRARNLTAHARSMYARWGLEAAQCAAAAGAPLAAVGAPLTESLRCRANPTTLLSAAGIYLAALRRRPPARSHTSGRW